MADARGLLGDSWAFTKAVGNGAYDAGAGMVEGLGDLAKGGYELATDASARESAWETTKQLAETAGNYGESVIDDPGKAYQDARDGVLAAYDKFEEAKDLAAAEGRSAEFYGDMAGGALFEVRTILVPVGLLAKAGKLGKVANVADEVADIANAAKKVENAEDIVGATQKAKAVLDNPVLEAIDNKASAVQKCPGMGCDVSVGTKKQKPPSKTEGKPNDCTTTCNDPIDVATGEFLDTRTDFVIPATLPIVFSRNYRTQSAATGLLSQKWSNTWSQHLQEEGEEIHFHNEEGQIITFDSAEAKVDSTHLRHPHLTLSGDKNEVIILFNQREQLSYYFKQHEQGHYRLEQITDPHNNNIRLHYNQQELFKISHSDGIELIVQSINGQLQSIHLQEQGKAPLLLVSYNYKEDYLTQVKSFQNGTFNYSYDHKGRMLSWADTQKTHVNYTYDERDRVIATGSKSGHHQGKLSYNEEQRSTQVTYPDAKVETYFYNKEGLVTRFIDGNSNEWTTQWNDQFKIVSQTNPLGHRHQYSYDKSGNLISHSDPEGRSSRYVYNEKSLLEEKLDAVGNSWKYTYTDQGDLKTLTNPLGESEHYHYAKNGQTITIDLPNGAKQRLEYDQNFRPNCYFDAKGIPHQVSYDILGRLQQQKDAQGNITRYEYTHSKDNLRGNLSRLINPDQSKINLNYDQEGLLASHTDAEGNSTRYQHGAFDLLESTIDAKNQTLRYEYDGETRFKAVTNQNKERYSYDYDKAGNLIKETDFSGLETHYRYDQGNQLIEKRAPDGSIHQYQYDRSGLLIQKSSLQSPQDNHSASIIKYQYDKNGQLTEADNGEVLLGYQYDALGRVIKETVDDKEITSHYQLGEWHRSQRGGDADLLQFAYDLNGQLQKMTLGAHQPLHFQRDMLGQETSRQTQAGFIAAQSHDSMGRLSQQVAGNKQQMGQLIDLQQPDPLKNLSNPDSHKEQLQVSRLYRWDNNHNPVEIADIHRGKQQYQYDARQQIEQSQHGLAMGQQPKQEQFSYSSGQQIEQRTTEKGTQAYHYLPGGRLLRQGLNQYSYDHAGRMIKKVEIKAGFRPKTWYYHWNADSQLSKLTTPEGDVWHYRYDAMGRRVRKFKSLKNPQQVKTETNTGTQHPAEQTADKSGEIIGEHYLWEGDNLIQQAPVYADGTVAWDQAEEWIYELDQMVPMAKRSTEGTLYYVVTDHLGTPKELITEDGNHTAWAGQFDTWGKFSGNIASLYQQEPKLLQAANEPEYKTDCPIRFQGQWADDESGLHYNRHRYYDPDAGQYISPDPIGLAGGLTPQGYVGNPNGWVDPLGLAGCSDITKSTDIKVLGRLEDTKVARDWDDHEVLNIKDWTIKKNDQWVQQGITNKQVFYTASPTKGNLWDKAANRETVYSRELNQIKDVGYVKKGDSYIHPDNL